MLRFEINAHLFASYFLWLISSETQMLPKNVFAFVWWVAALQVVSVTINQLQEFVVFLNTYTFFLYIWVRKVPWGRKKRQNCCNLETYRFSWHYQSSSVSSCGEFCWNTLYCLYIDASLRLQLIPGEEPLPCRLQSYSITQSSGISLKKAKSRFPSGPEDIFLNVVLLQTWTAVIKHLKHPHQSQKHININYNNRCRQNAKTSVN